MPQQFEPQAGEGGQLPPRVTSAQAGRETREQAERILGDVNPEEYSFSPQAFSELKERVGEYVSDLVTESAKDAKRHQDDVVSKANVVRASEYLVSNSARRTSKIIGTIGGVFAGAGVSEFVTLAAGGHMPLVGTIIAFVLY